MNPLSPDIRQHDTHSTLYGQTGPQDAVSANLDLDAIIVPASRPASHLDHAVTLAKFADCWLLVLCSQDLRSAEVRQFLAARSFTKAIVIDLPRGYSHELLYFPALLSLKDDLPQACGSYVTDLSMKRNVGLVLARMLQWRRIFFLDDDIRDINCPDLQKTVNMLGTFPAVGMWVTDYPDNSIVCHANRMTKGSQDVFVSGAALAVDCHADIGFFPDIYNEDWLFFFDDAAAGRLANSCLKATQLRYYPFASARRAAWQEFGDLMAEGLYALLHLDLGVQQATREYWTHFLEARWNFLEGITTRSRNADPDIRADILFSVQSALKCSLKIKPDLCERYIQSWRQDLEDWKRRAAGIPQMPTIEAALQEMRLWPKQRSSTGRIRHVRAEPAEKIIAGPVTIPRFDTMKKLPDQASTFHLSPAAAAPTAEIEDTLPLPALTDDSDAPSAAAANCHDRISSDDEEHGRYGKLRFSLAIPWVGSIWWVGIIMDARPRRRASAVFDAHPRQLETAGWSEPADSEPKTTICGEGACARSS